jgi:hypothetical protein
MMMHGPLNVRYIPMCVVCVLFQWRDDVASFIHASRVGSRWLISRSVMYSKARQGLLAVRNVTHAKSIRHGTHLVEIGSLSSEVGCSYERFSSFEIYVRFHI